MIFHIKGKVSQCGTPGINSIRQQIVQSSLINYLWIKLRQQKNNWTSTVRIISRTIQNSCCCIKKKTEYFKYVYTASSVHFQDWNAGHTLLDKQYILHTSILYFLTIPQTLHLSNYSHRSLISMLILCLVFTYLFNILWDEWDR